MNHPGGRIGILLMLAFGLAGCASISVEPHSETIIHRMPEEIYVNAFATGQGEFNVDREGAELREFKINLQQMLATAMAGDLSGRLIPASVTKQKFWDHPETAWLIRGRFVRVNQGSRLLRGAIGFGMGGTKLETRIEVYDLSGDQTQPFLVFSTTGGSNAEPGAITAIATDPLTIAVEAVAGGAGGIAHGLTEDTKRTAREITAELSDYMYRRGWIPKSEWIKPKHLDQ